MKPKQRNAKKIIHRKPNFQIPQDIEKYWLGGSVFKTHFLNSFTLIFPIGERYFIRSINCMLKKINDPILLTEAQSFIKQEAQHAIEHGRFMNILKNQGLEFEGTLKYVEFLIEKILAPMNGEALNLAVTSGLEHMTALLAEISLSENFLKEAPSSIRDLYNWHAAEEIEHRAVAFDILSECHPHFALRVAGLFYAYVLLSGLTAFFTAKLIVEDGKIFNKVIWTDFFDTFIFKEKLLFKAAGIFVNYLSPDFHPLNEKIDHLGKSIFKQQNNFASSL